MNQKATLKETRTEIKVATEIEERDTDQKVESEEKDLGPELET